MKEKLKSRDEIILDHDDNELLKKSAELLALRQEGIRDTYISSLESNMRREK